ncbi:MAG: hypothetical protein ACK5AO_01935 [bacterium]|jgi:hypothetical protein
MKVFKTLSVSGLAMLFCLLSFGQTADEIINKHIEAIGGKENWKKVNSIRQEGTVSVQGMEIPVITTTLHNKATKQEYTAMGMSVYSIITTEGGWSLNPMAGQTEPETMGEDQLKYGRYQLDAQGEFIDYKEKGHTLELLENEDVDGVSCFRIKLNRKGGTSSTFFIDPKSFYVIRNSSTINAGGQSVELILNLSNHQKLPEGIVVPYTMENSQIPAPLNITKVEINGKIDEAIFKVSK